MRTKLLSGYFMCLFLLASLITSATQLSGTYSINPSATATTTNFQDFNSAITFLTGSGTRGDGGPANSSPFGVSGAVTFLVAAGTYAQQVNITTTIVGTSTVNTVSFDGGNGNASTRVITYSGVSTNYPTVNITNNPNIVFRNLTINNTGTTYGFGVLITGSSNGCKINNCSINLPLTAFSFYPIVIGGMLTGNTNGGGRVDSLQIDSNTIIGGVQSIVIYSTSSNPGVQNKIRYNQILNFYAWGMNISYENGMNILYNKLIQSVSNVNGVGIGGTYMNNNGPNVTIISGNKIVCTGGQAIQLFGSNAAGNKGFITNNMLGGGLKSSTYLFSMSGSNWCISNNSFNYDIVSSSSSSNCPFYLNASSNVSVINNIFSVKQIGNAALAVYIPSIYYIDSMDYNVFYRQDTSDHQLIILGSTYNSGNFKGAGGFNQHSQYLNPGFVNDTNLHISQTCLRGISLPYVTTDIDGNTRNSPPNIGACEVQAASNDIGVVAILSPVYPIGAGAQNLRARVINYGSNTVISFNLNYKLNGNTPVTKSWSGILNPCDTVSILFNGSQQITIPSGSNTLKVYTSSPNGTTDGNMANDTITTTFLTAMGGNYIIGTSPSDYTSFSAALSDLNYFGVSSAVRFSVKSGTYNENLSVSIPTGVSSTNNVSFTSIANNRDSVIVNATTGYVMNLSGSYFSFKNLTFNQTATTSSGVISLTGTPLFDTIYNCKLIAPNTSITSSNVVYGNGVSLNNILFRKNIIQGGYNGLNIISNSSNYSTNCILDSNTLQNTYYANTLEYFSNLKFRNNTINVNSNNQMFFIEYANTGYEFSGNQINVSAGLTANMFISYYCAGTSVNRLKISNNTFTAASTASINLFAPYYYAGFVDFYNNSLALGNGYLEIGYNSNDIRCYNNSISSNNSNYSFYQNESGNTNIDVKNNVVSNTNGGVALYWDINPSGTTFDYNNLYTTGSNLVSINSGATSYSNLSAWRGAYGLDKNSLSYRPAFTNSASNLAPNITDSACWSLNGRGMPATFITSDINGNPRSSQILTGATDIGAYEFTPTVNPPFAIASPASPTASTTQYFSFGSDTIAQIIWGTSVPSSITAQLYSGTNAPQVGGTSFYQTNAYWNILAPAGTYSYNLKLNYKKNWLQNIPSESNMVIAQKSTGISWAIASSTHTIDTVNNIMAANSLTHFSYFAGTDATFPLPVQLISFEVKPIGNGQNAISKVLCTWETASELNNDYFEIQRSFEPAANSQWLTAGTVKGNGTTNIVSNYQFTDLINLSTNQPINIYYRLNQVDFDGKSTLSDVRVVSLNQLNTDWNIYPNPTTNELHIETSTNEKFGVQLFDIAGKKVMENVLFTNGTTINTQLLTQGLYFVRITDANGAIIKVQKVALVK